MKMQMGKKMKSKCSYSGLLRILLIQLIATNILSTCTQPLSIQRPNSNMKEKAERSTIVTQDMVPFIGSAPSSIVGEVKREDLPKLKRAALKGDKDARLRVVRFYLENNQRFFAWLWKK
jgi:hypothetical protein